MTQVFYTVEINEKIAKNVYKLVLLGDTSAITAPGQFVNFKVEGCYLRRPISVCAYDEGVLTVIYKVVGQGTDIMAKWEKGYKVDTLVGLGNGYELTECGDAPLLIGGGVGVPPMYQLCRKLREAGKPVQVILGFGKQDEVFYEDEFKALGAQVYVTTADGSYGTKGFVTDVMCDLEYSYFYTCGPEPMFRAIEKIAKTSGQYSFEERMGCGFGACMGCSCKTLYGNKRICVDGPVLRREEIIWQTQE
ncbi:MAG: dihydroorotate dehydrogenase electron transfer subunit [Clostridia bacterium]|nr:dihydroorotate dehydrogenase electron transfer subunit [Clostridia bacterium]